MINELRFVQGAVSRKTDIPELLHFKITNQTIQSFNGSLALSTPIGLDLDCIPLAAPFVKAIRNCNETVTMSITQKGRLSIKSGKFKVFIECLPLTTELPHVEPEGIGVTVDGEILLQAFKTLYPFIGDNTAHPFANGILLKDRSAVATNNVSLAEYWIGTPFPSICNIPKTAIKELIRINLPPTAVQISDNSITFHFEDKRWVRSQLLSTKWPDTDKILNIDSNAVPVNDQFFIGIDTIKPLIEKTNYVYLKNGLISTSILPENGASFELDNFNYEGVYKLDLLTLLKESVTHIDFSTYPAPCAFFGDKLRGVIIGIKNES